MGSLFGKAPSPQPAPIIAPPPVMPTPDDASVKAAKKKSTAMLLAGRGRMNSINTMGDQTDTLA